MTLFTATLCTARPVSRQRARHAVSVLLAATSLLLSLPWQAARAAEAAQFVGHWYGEILRDGQQHRFVIDREANGRFEMRYRIYLGTELMVARSLAGNWALRDDGTYYTRTTKITDETGSYAPPTETGYYEDHYTVLRADANEIHTRHEKNGNEVIVKRVADDFVLP